MLPVSHADVKQLWPFKCWCGRSRLGDHLLQVVLVHNNHRREVMKIRIGGKIFKGTIYCIFLPQIPPRSTPCLYNVFQWIFVWADIGEISIRICITAHSFVHERERSGSEIQLTVLYIYQRARSGSVTLLKVFAPRSRIRINKIVDSFYAKHQDPDQ